MMIPKALSVGEECFALQCQAYKFTPEREYRFCEGRKYAFDFAFPDSMIAIEIEGGTRFGKSRHSRGDGFENDAVKYNTATRLGWKVYRYSTAMVQRGDAINDLLSVIWQEDLG
jgi:very-short-patch-repair endonuclease